MGKPFSHIVVYIIRITQILASLGEISLAILIIVTYNELPISFTDSWTDPQGSLLVPFICYVTLSGLCIIRIILSFLVNTHRSLDPSLDEMLFLAWAGVDLYLYLGRHVYVTNCSSQKQLVDVCFYNNITFFGAVGQSGLWLIGALATRIANGGCCRPKQNKVNSMPVQPPPAVQSTISIPENVEPESIAGTKPQPQQPQYQQSSWHQQPQVYQQQSQRYQQLPQNSYVPTPQQNHYNAQTQSFVYTPAQSIHTIQHSPKAAYMLSSTAQTTYMSSPLATTSYGPPISQPSAFVNNVVDSEKIAVEDDFEKVETAAVEVQPIIAPQYQNSGSEFIKRSNNTEYI